MASYRKDAAAQMPMIKISHRITLLHLWMVIIQCFWGINIKACQLAAKQVSYGSYGYPAKNRQDSEVRRDNEKY